MSDGSVWTENCMCKRMPEEFFVNIFDEDTGRGSGRIFKTILYSKMEWTRTQHMFLSFLQRPILILKRSAV